MSRICWDFTRHPARGCLFCFVCLADDEDCCSTKRACVLDRAAQLRSPQGDCLILGTKRRHAPRQASAHLSGLSSSDRCHMIPNPGQDVLELTVVGLQQSDNKPFAFVGSSDELPAVEAQEHVCSEEYNSLVAIDKGVIDQQRLKHRRGRFLNICVVASPWSKEDACQESPVANTIVRRQIAWSIAPEWRGPRRPTGIGRRYRASRWPSSSRIVL